MAQLTLSRVGASLGARFLPNGVSAFGFKIAGKALGRKLGSVVGRAIDDRFLTPPIEGPRIHEFHITEGREGASIPVVYGRTRVGGQVIWTGGFKESRREQSGGKGGPRVREYSYALSFAVALGEGEISRVARCWANGEPFDLSKVTWRFYSGSGEQMPDPLIEASEGDAPGFRGVSYVVFEDMPVDAFGARMPQMSFEVLRPSGGGEARLENVARAVNVIPGSGEFALATEVVRRRTGPGIETAENVHSGEEASDFEASLNQLEAELPNVRRVNLIVGWFGDDLRCGSCRVKPGVETAEKETYPLEWSVGGVVRGQAYVVSQSDGRSNYGGTPSDESVRQAVGFLKARGFHVTIYPFVFMDVVAGNSLPDPYGGAEQKSFPWRGRITCHPAEGVAGSVADSAAARTQVEAFFDGVDGYDAFVLHYAQLAQETDADGLLIGSEMVGLTHVRDEVGGFPAVERLKALAQSVRGVLGAGVEVSYAADWTEYGARVRDGGGDVSFPLDALWAEDTISYVGVDWYPPMSDWRDGDGHVDSDFSSAHDPAYLAQHIAGGEAYDWYYADEVGRAAQERLAIGDGAYGEPFVFRQKDIAGWWGHVHRDRVNSVQAAATEWVAGMKPVRFVEMGCPAVDKGANQPNVFVDPKSSESGVPHYSTGARDDLVQRRLIEAFHAHWSVTGNNPQSTVYSGAMVPDDGIGLWCWDARPFPAFPALDSVWSDGTNWRLGHWLNGRVGLALLADVVLDVCERTDLAGVVDASGLSGVVSGFRFDGPVAAGAVLGALGSAFEFSVVERFGGVAVRNLEASPLVIDPGEIVERDDGATIELYRLGMEALPGALRVSYVDSEQDYQTGVVVVGDGGDERLADVQVPVVMDEGQASRLGRRLLERLGEENEVRGFALPASGVALEAGDRVMLNGETLRAGEVSYGRVNSVRAVRSSVSARELATVEPSVSGVVEVRGVPDVVLVNAPALPGQEDDVRPFAFVFGSPWLGPVTLSVEADGVVGERGVVVSPCRMGRLVDEMIPRVSGSWIDEGVVVDVFGDGPVSRSEGAVLNGANAALVEGRAGWELVQFVDAELVSDGRYRLSRFLRGQQGSEPEMLAGAEVGARIVFLTGDESRIDVKAHEWGEEMPVRAWRERWDEPSAYVGVFVPEDIGRRMWSPAHLRGDWQNDGLNLSWIRRSRIDGDSWTRPEVPLAVDERYRLRVGGLSAQIGEWEVAEPEFVYSAVEIAENFSSGDVVWVDVAQIGPYGDAGAVAKVQFLVP